MNTGFTILAHRHLHSSGALDMFLPRRPPAPLARRPCPSTPQRELCPRGTPTPGPSRCSRGAHSAPVGLPAPGPRALNFLLRPRVSLGMMPSRLTRGFACVGIPLFFEVSIPACATIAFARHPSEASSPVASWLSQIGTRSDVFGSFPFAPESGAWGPRGHSWFSVQKDLLTASRRTCASSSLPRSHRPQGRAHGRQAAVGAARLTDSKGRAWGDTGASGDATERW